MPSKSLAQHRMWVVKLHAKNSTDEERKVAKEFLDADKEAGLYQDVHPTATVLDWEDMDDPAT